MASCLYCALNRQQFLVELVTDRQPGGYGVTPIDMSSKPGESQISTASGSSPPTQETTLESGPRCFSPDPVERNYAARRNCSWAMIVGVPARTWSMPEGPLRMVNVHHGKTHLSRLFDDAPATARPPAHPGPVAQPGPPVAGGAISQSGSGG